jgi:hypothetical protein
MIKRLVFNFNLRRYNLGATVGGVVGHKMLRYHLFGPPLEGLNRMEQTCDPGGVRRGLNPRTLTPNPGPKNQILNRGAWGLPTRLLLSST